MAGISLHIEADDVSGLQVQLKGLLAGGAWLEQPAIATVTQGPPLSAETVEVADAAEPVPEGGKVRNQRRKAPAANTRIEVPAAEKTDTPVGITIEDAREKMKKFAADGHMEQVAEALTACNAKKVSEVDPEANGKPSQKFAYFVADIERRIAEKPAAEA